MKKILGLTVAALLVMGLVGGGTWAYFSDTETSTGNTLTAGTLDLTPDEGTIYVMSYDASDGMAPGWISGGADSWTLTNSGTVDGDLTITIGAIANADETDEEPESDDAGNTPGGDLGANLDVEFWVDLDGSTTSDATVWADAGAMNGYMDIGEGEVIYSGVLDSMPATFPTSGKIDLNNGASINVYFDASIDTLVGNRIMSDSCTFDITFNLNQTP